MEEIIRRYMEDIILFVWKCYARLTFHCKIIAVT